MPIEQLEALLTDPSMQEAVAVVFDRSDGGSKELEWSDVRTDLSGRQWGRLLDEGVLVSAGAGFAIADPEQVRSHLKKGGTSGEPIGDGAADTAGPSRAETLFDDANLPPMEPVRWSSFDKTAGAVAFLLFIGYWSTRVRGIVASAENVLLGPVTDVVPFHVVILLLAIGTGFYSTMLQSRLTDREKLRRYQRRLRKLKEYQQAAKERGDDEALERIREQQLAAAADQLGMMKLRFRPTVWTMLLTIPIFLWLRWKVNGGHLGADEIGMVVPLAGAVSWRQPLVGPISAWIVWYFLCSVASRQIIQKALAIGTGTSS
ncbi:DUF106 domain-containing protein [Halosolutus gelatinilyticus]|uniref:DUF106 domain-containing protein n=1 Tax=Halosolutus gelatinilyticus TaxID=2931975 RepID=UPI001FF5A32C|nr:DUF106 domain-containing protein [Halosolutus gelatinilyticus]